MEKEELLHELCIQCKSRITETGSKRTFPCNLIQVELSTLQFSLLWGQDKAEGQRQISHFLIDCLQKHGCLDLTGVRINVSFVNNHDNKQANQKDSNLSVRFYQITTVIKSASLSLFPDTANQKVYSLGLKRYHIGRGAGGTYHGIEYHNNISFEDNGKDPNAGVGSCHARIEYNQQKNRYILFDLESKNKTRLIRDGITYFVDHVTGQLLEHGDYVYFGKAPARFSLEIATKSIRC